MNASKHHYQHLKRSANQLLDNRSISEENSPSTNQ